ncbi:hypothetical protein F441_10564 [Phytophthora nicotianae CJ01A1]|uniref:Uncharacterized protein n=1 Tax=Phytophthora nicotianae CJ01A1 TaxID=1317063 RepID=W2WVZ3_PHYNI|nr:hypothetical protein F441_10564 [Phytophthora nicotianae CJ01A1]
MKLFNTEKLLVARQTVVVGDEPIFYVFDAFDSRSNTSKNAHIQVLGVAQYDVRKYFNSAYLVRHLRDAVESLSIQLPLEAELLDSNDVKPPPMYR